MPIKRTRRCIPDNEKTKEELLQELKALRARVAQPEQPECKRAVDVPRESEEKYRSLIINIPEVIWTTDIKGNTIFISPTVEKVFGYNPGEIYKAGDSLWFGRIHPDDVQKVKDAFETLFEKGKRFDIEYRIKRKDGKWIWLYGRALNTYEIHGVKYADGIFSDITERKRAEQALRESENKYRDLIEEMTDVIYTLDTEGNVTSVNKAGKATFGREPGEVLGKSFTKWIPQEHLPDAMVAFKRILGGEKITAETVMLDKQRRPHNVEFSSSPIIEDGKAVGTCGIIRDITERKKMEQALLESQRWQRAILDSIPDIAWLKDKESKYIAANEALCKAFGIKFEDFVGKTDFDISPKDLAQRYRTDDQEVIKSGKRKHIEEEWGRKHGERIWIETIKTPIYNDQGQVIGTSGIARDITDRKKAEQQLRESEEKYRQVVSTTTDAVTLFDAETRQFVEVNKACEELYGYSREEFLNLKHSDITAEPEKSNESIEKTLEGKLYRIPVRYHRKKDGTVFPVEISAGTFELRGRRILCGVVRDITERKKAEKKISKLSSAVEQSIDGIAIGDLKPRLLYINEAYARMHGYSREEMIGMPVTRLHNKEQLAVYKKALNQLKTQGSWEGEIGHIRKDGTAFPTYASVTLLRDDNSKPLGTLAVARDISESKRREKELNIYREKMVRTEQLASLGTLSATLAHELTQPLTVVRLSIENSLAELNSMSYSGAAIEGLNAGLKGISNATSIVRQFRNFAKESLENEVKKVDLEMVAKRIVQLLEVRGWRTRITMLLQEMDKLPPIYSYEKDLEQLFFALVENAIEAANGKKDRQLTISGNIKDENIELKFFDNCGGIAPEILDRIFEPFFTTKATSQATGLGLCIVEQIVSRAGGKVRIESKPGEGSIFIITLPIKRDNKYCLVKNGK